MADLIHRTMYLPLTMTVRVYSAVVLEFVDVRDEWLRDLKRAL